MALSENARELCRRGSSLFEKRQGLLSMWQEIARIFYPERADFTSPLTWGEEFGTDLFDSTPQMCRRDLGNAFAAMLRPRGQPWFKCVDPDEEVMENPSVSAWYDHMTEVGRRHLYNNRSRFVRSTKEGDQDFAAFGNTVISCELNRDKNGLLFRTHHLRDCAWAEDAEGAVDTMFRKMDLTARQMRQTFGEDALHADVRRALDQEPDKTFQVWHVMMPAEDYEFSRRKRNKAQPWASLYIDHEHQEILRESQAHEFRYVVPRWQTVSGWPYAVSPAVTVALADARGMQVMKRVLLEGGEKAVDPPMKAVTEAIRGDINLYAGGVTVIDRDYDSKTGDPLEPLMMDRANLQFGLQLLAQASLSQREAWFLTKLTLPQGAKTAYETARLVEEYVRANIPLFEPLETEYNGALLDLTYSILTRERAFDFGQMPQELQGRDFEFSFSNPLQDAIERNRVNQATTVVGLVAGVAKIDPTIPKAIDWHKMARDVVRGSGAPAEWLVDEQAAEQQIQNQQAGGDILAALNGAGQAADVVNRGAEAALKLQQTGLLPAPPAAETM